MSAADRIAKFVTSNARIVLVSLLLTTALVGAGASMVDDDSSLEQFESDSPEGEAMEAIDDRFGVDDEEETTSVQVITRGDGENVLTRESLLESLEFQEEIRENGSINETLVEDDAITGVENVVAITAITNEQIAELEELGDDIEERETELNETSEELEERGEELEQRGEELEERGGELEERGAELEQREAELNETSERLEDGIDASIGIQREYEELAATYDEDDPEYQEGAAELEAEFDATIEEATAGLDDEQAAEYEELAQQARAIESDRFAIEQTTDDPESDPEYQELTEALEDVYLGATMAVLEEEYEQLEEEADELEAERAQLEAESEQLEEDSEQLEAESEQLEEEYERLGEDAEELEELQDELEDDDGPTLDEQIETLSEIDDDEFEEALEDALSDDDENQGAALGFMPSDYDPGSTEADARMTFVTQEIGDADIETGAVDEDVLETQLDLQELAAGHEHEQIVFGVGIITDEIDRSMGDSLAIVGPLALAFVVAALLIAYRDPLDIVLGVVGIVTVLVWTFGFMGWTGIAFNQMMIAIPVLLIGLSIDYAIHVFMRYREQRETPRVSDERTGSEPTREQRETPRVSDERAESEPTREHRETPRVSDERTGDRAVTDSSTVRGSMGVALAGVGVALVWVTATTAIGFLANLISPIGPIQEFGVVSAFGILAALVVFGGLIPAAKVEIDSALEARGFDRRKRAFGTGGGRLGDVLSVGAVAARRAPLVLLLVVLLVTAGGVYGASQVDTSFDEEDFLAESPPAWTESLPGGMAPGEYQAAGDLDYVNENFQRDDLQAQILVEGDVADGDVLERLETAQDEAAASDVAYTLPNGEADVQGPLSVMEETAAQNESFNESFEAADTTGDGIPDENVEALYDELFEVNEDEARQVLHRSDDGTYDATRLIVAVEGDAAFEQTTDEMRAIAATIDDDGVGDERGLEAGERADGESTNDDEIDEDDPAVLAGSGGVSAIATGDPIVNYIVEQDLLDTVLQSLLITLVAVFTFLSIAYRLTGNSATLGVVTLLPVAFAVSWILGTMYLIGMPFNVLTGMITSLTIGLGVAYSIHVSSRYTLELERQGNVWLALETTVTGTGGALLGSAATTVGGFGTLAFAILPVLEQFGIITALTITYAFLASVIVLPTLLVLWTRYFGPDVSFDVRSLRRPTPTASDGGMPEDVDRDGGEENPADATETNGTDGATAGGDVDSAGRSRPDDGGGE
ncbi:MMPL family transporter [Natrialba sp. INN-245]|uniref:MMPL family transporter n=1 Tax=Natrialba sp. INN-245 TaxID=2690967 RepID=UPI0013127786|nr:MMPL family transporter [Natrialba sp. INN-245]MWV38518.1 MMPL family transporter [Natrialba sp. INN-245]